MLPQTPTANPQDLKCCAGDGQLWIVSTVFLQGYFTYLLPFFKYLYNTCFFYHRQHFNSIVAHLYMFRDVHIVTHAGSQASL